MLVLIGLDYSNNGLVVLTWIRAFFGIEPRLKEPVSVGSEWTQFDALLFLLVALLSAQIGDLSLKTAVQWIVDVNVSAWTRAHALSLLLEVPHSSRVESWVDGLLLNDLVPQVILLLLVIVVAWPDHFGEGLPGVRSLAFVLPVLTPGGL